MKFILCSDNPVQIEDDSWFNDIAELFDTPHSPSQNTNQKPFCFDSWWDSITGKIKREEDLEEGGDDTTRRLNIEKRKLENLFSESEVDAWGAGPPMKKQKLANFEIKQTGVKHFARRVGKQTTHKVTLGKEWAGSKVNDVQNDLRDVIREVLKTSRGDAKDSDLGNLILHNDGLSKDIAITLRPWSE